MNALKTLYRPTAPEELLLIINTDMKSFPPRLFWQPIFYPVLNFQYAAEIAEQWNRGDVDSDGAGFITAFDIPEEYFLKFKIQTVGLKYHQELWVPAEQLDEFNNHIVGSIRVEKAFIGKRFIVKDQLKEFISQ